MMAELVFKYGSMNAAKSLQLLLTAYAHAERGMAVLCLNPAAATRDHPQAIVSRTGLRRPAQRFEVADDLRELTQPLPQGLVLVDEAQFLTIAQVQQLAQVVDERNLGVECYGLLTDFAGEFFEGSLELMRLADRQVELSSMCVEPGCWRNAIFNLRYVAGKPAFRGEQVAVDAEYRSVCRKHYLGFKSIYGV